MRSYNQTTNPYLLPFDHASTKYPRKNKDDNDHGQFGVHVEFEDLYYAILFVAAIFVGGKIANLVLMSSLVGEIIVGIVLGPNLLEFVPSVFTEAFVLLGEIGLILLVIEAGIDIDLTTMKLIGTRGIIIAVVGSILPIGIAVGLAFALGIDTVGAIAAGGTYFV